MNPEHLFRLGTLAAGATVFLHVILRISPVRPLLVMVLVSFRTTGHKKNKPRGFDRGRLSS